MRRAMTAAVLAVAAACVTVAPAGGGIGEWNARHPQAARELCAWVQNHPDAARRFFEWDGHHYERSHEFVTWAITHPAEGIDAFVAQHPGWGNFDVMAETHRPAANAFIAWCRRHPQAAEDLMNHPNGLEWAGRHLAC